MSKKIIGVTLAGLGLAGSFAGGMVLSNNIKDDNYTIVLAEKEEDIASISGTLDNLDKQIAEKDAQISLLKTAQAELQTKYDNLVATNSATEEELANMNVVVSFTHHTGKVHEVVYNVNDADHPISVDHNGYVKVVVDDLAPADAEIEVFCKVYNGEVSEENLALTVVDSIESYCGYYATDSSASANLRDVCEKIVKYSKSAYAYFHEND